eukprot:gnl/Chilomastix_cuspidata/96.p1 GENE.gnl/Chilomastix_cuspidata/96~~gnl/Chilomastix_cuspidata/96.p1  ORF type:complete len:1188 (+),score=418.51 gnl/Chilomastix_cuspidata/96:211-3564(+)
MLVFNRLRRNMKPIHYIRSGYTKGSVRVVVVGSASPRPSGKATARFPLSSIQLTLTLKDGKCASKWSLNSTPCTKREAQDFASALHIDVANPFMIMPQEEADVLAKLSSEQKFSNFLRAVSAGDAALQQEIQTIAERAKVLPDAQKQIESAQEALVTLETRLAQLDKLHRKAKQWRDMRRLFEEMRAALIWKRYFLENEKSEATRARLREVETLFRSCQETQTRLHGEIEQIRVNLNFARTRSQKTFKRANTLTREVAAARGELAKIDRKVQDLTRKKEQLEQLLLTVSQRKEEEGAQREERRAKNLERIEEAKDTLKRIGDALPALEQKLQRAVQAVESLRGQKQEAYTRYSEANHAFQEFETRERAIKEFQTLRDNAVLGLPIFRHVEASLVRFLRAVEASSFEKPVIPLVGSRVSLHSQRAFGRLSVSPRDASYAYGTLVLTRAVQSLCLAFTPRDQRRLTELERENPCGVSVFSLHTLPSADRLPDDARTLLPVFSRNLGLHTGYVPFLSLLDGPPVCLLALALRFGMHNSLVTTDAGVSVRDLMATRARAWLDDFPADPQYASMPPAMILHDRIAHTPRFYRGELIGSKSERQRRPPQGFPLHTPERLPQRPDDEALKALKQTFTDATQDLKAAENSAEDIQAELQSQRDRTVRIENRIKEFRRMLEQVEERTETTGPSENDVKALERQIERHLTEFRSKFLKFFHNANSARRAFYSSLQQRAKISPIVEDEARAQKLQEATRHELNKTHAQERKLRKRLERVGSNVEQLQSLCEATPVSDEAEARTLIAKITQQIATTKGCEVGEVEDADIERTVASYKARLKHRIGSDGLSERPEVRRKTFETRNKLREMLVDDLRTRVELLARRERVLAQLEEIVSRISCSFDATLGEFGYNGSVSITGTHVLLKPRTVRTSFLSFLEDAAEFLEVESGEAAAATPRVKGEEAAVEGGDELPSFRVDPIFTRCAKESREALLAKLGLGIRVDYHADLDSAVIARSGGENSVASLALMAALHGESRFPFRLVDEINQGMDERNQRAAHRVMTGGARAEGHGTREQYFIGTPKLPNSLPFHADMAIHIISFAPWNPARNERKRLKKCGPGGVFSAWEEGKI